MAVTAISTGRGRHAHDGVCVYVCVHVLDDERVCFVYGRRNLLYFLSAHLEAL